MNQSGIIIFPTALGHANIFFYFMYEETEAQRGNLFKIQSNRWQGWFWILGLLSSEFLSCPCCPKLYK